MIHIHNHRLFVIVSVAIIALTAIVLLNSCEELRDEPPTDAYIGGQIINPRSNYLVLYRKNKPLDTVYLDDRNRISYRMTDVEEGLYLFQHAPEFQNLYLSPGDSILLRVNTIEFDESIYFSGKGAERNNFLMDMFLLDESNADLLLAYYKTEPPIFALKTDSIRMSRIALLQDRSKKHNFSEPFRELAQKTIDYESYDLRERYTYLVRKYYKQFSGNFPPAFHAYRQVVDFNEASMQNSPGYKRFIENYLINKSLTDCAQSALDRDDCYSLTDHENIKSRIETISRLTQIPSLREHFFSKLGVLGIVMAKTSEDITAILDLLEAKGYPQDQLEELKELGEIQLTYLPGTSVKDVPLLNADGQITRVKEVIDDPTIIFLWSINSGAHKDNHDLVSQLREKYPEVDFVGVNMDVGETAAWRMTLEEYGYDTTKEFQIADSRVNKDFFKFYLNKLLFLDPSGKVIIGDAFINSPDLEDRILEFISQ